jgi:hypothetical protein
MTREELIAALEKATGPDRALDGETYVAIGLPAPTEILYKTLDGAGIGLRYGGVSKYTASIDAALTLVPERWQIDSMGKWSHDALRDAGPWFAILMPKGDLSTTERTKQHTRCDHAPTPALALCIAALKARGDRA